MRAFLLFQLRTIRSKYWLLPSLMALLAMVLAVVLIVLDAHIGADWLEGLSGLHANQPAGARAVLSTIAGSMITVAGVTFSITILALATSASSFGPRLITNFMQDRGNQLTLGTFIATFTYCLMVLRTVRSADEGGTNFVPQVAVLVGVLFALASLGVLIYFIHHIPESIHITTVVANLGREFADKVDEVYPRMIGDPAPKGEAKLRRALERGFSRQVFPKAAGYVQYVDGDGLMAYAHHANLWIELVARPGDFVTPRCVLARVTALKDVESAVFDRVRDAVVVGRDRSPTADILYLVERLVEVAARALSPGTNDVYSALNAIDWIGNGLVAMASRSLPDAARQDADGESRILTRPVRYSEMVEAGIGALRPYAARDPNAARRLMEALARVAQHTAEPGRLAALEREATNLQRAALEHLSQPADREPIEDAFRVCLGHCRVDPN